MDRSRNPALTISCWHWRAGTRSRGLRKWDINRHDSVRFDRDVTPHLPKKAAMLLDAAYQFFWHVGCMAMAAIAMQPTCQKNWYAASRSIAAFFGRWGVTSRSNRTESCRLISHLRSPRLRVPALQCQQLIVSAGFLDLSIHHHVND